MTRLLLMEGNTAEKRAKAVSLGVRSSSEIYALALRSEFPDFALDVINAADPDWLIPEGRSFEDYDGLVITGSSLHAYDKEYAVTNQIEVLKDAAETGIPIFGSCWGLQIAVKAAGGQVEYSPNGREVGIARKIVPNDVGRSHPLLRGKGDAFDAPCIHYDEVSRMPEGAVLLASNAHSKVQAAIVPLRKSEVWAVQYHPEFDLDQLIQLYTLYADDMIVQGFFADGAALDNYVSNLSALAADPTNQGLGWQLGMDEDITDPKRRRGEIINWVEACVLPSA
ncbi:MAG: type 1 glutamine amidotransferase [Chakrabartia sp.]